MYWFSDKYIWVPLYAFLLFLMFRENRNHFWLVLLMVALLVTLTDQISVKLFKDVFVRLRPCHEPALDGMVRTLYGQCGGKYGFVSSHATNTFGVAVFTGLVLAIRYKWIIPVMLAGRPGILQQDLSGSPLSWRCDHMPTGARPISRFYCSDAEIPSPEGLASCLITECFRSFLQPDFHHGNVFHCGGVVVETSRCV